MTLLEQLRRLEPGDEWWRIALGRPGHTLDLEVLRDIIGNAEQRCGPPHEEVLVGGFPRALDGEVDWRC